MLVGLYYKNICRSIPASINAIKRYAKVSKSLFRKFFPLSLPQLRTLTMLGITNANQISTAIAIGFPYVLLRKMSPATIITLRINSTSIVFHIHCIILVSCSLGSWSIPWIFAQSFQKRTPYHTYPITNQSAARAKTNIGWERIISNIGRKLYVIQSWVYIFSKKKRYFYDLCHEKKYISL